MLHYELRRGATGTAWASMVSINGDNPSTNPTTVKASRFVVTDIDSGEYDFAVKAVDRSGNESATAATDTETMTNLELSTFNLKVVKYTEKNKVYTGVDAVSYTHLRAHETDS